MQDLRLEEGMSFTQVPSSKSERAFLLLIFEEKHLLFLLHKNASDVSWEGKEVKYVRRIDFMGNVFIGIGEIGETKVECESLCKNR